MKKSGGGKCKKMDGPKKEDAASTQRGDIESNDETSSLLSSKASPQYEDSIFYFPRLQDITPEERNFLLTKDAELKKFQLMSPEERKFQLMSPEDRSKVIDADIKKQVF